MFVGSSDPTGPQLNSAFPQSLVFLLCPHYRGASPPSQCSQARNPRASLITSFCLLPVLVPPPHTHSPFWPHHGVCGFPSCRLSSAARPLYKLCLPPRTHLLLLYCQRTALPSPPLGAPRSPYCGEVTKLNPLKSPDSDLRFSCPLLLPVSPPPGPHPTPTLCQPPYHLIEGIFLTGKYGHSAPRSGLPGNPEDRRAELTSDWSLLECKSSYSFMQQIFIEHLLCVPRHCARCWEIKQGAKKTKLLLSCSLISSGGKNKQGNQSVIDR